MHDSLIFENIRCFTHPSPVSLAPLTLLVGENSTGKSTFLVPSNGLGYRFWLRRSKFQRGTVLSRAYDQIANYAGGRRGREILRNRLGIDFSQRADSIARSSRYSEKEQSLDSDRVKYLVKYKMRASQPEVAERSVRCGQYGIVIDYGESGAIDSFRFELPDGQIAKFDPTDLDADFRGRASRLPANWFFLDYTIHNAREVKPLLPSFGSLCLTLNSFRLC